MSVFLDAGVLVGMVTPWEKSHARAVGIFERIADRRLGAAYTSDCVLIEALNFLRRKVRRREPAEELKRLVFGSEETAPTIVEVHRVHATRFAKALEHYFREFDRGLSFTDWTIVVLMREKGIDTLATFDSGFDGLVNVVRA